MLITRNPKIVLVILQAPISTTGMPQHIIQRGKEEGADLLLPVVGLLGRCFRLGI